MSTWLEQPVNLKNFLSSEENMIGQTIILKLTLNGVDLANKYDNWFTRTGLWFAEYKDHWLWLILSFLGGILGALLVNWLSKILG